MSLSNREFLIWKERGRGGVRERGVRERGAGQQAGIFRFVRDRGERQRDRET
jgi:hypothetical protein